MAVLLESPWYQEILQRGEAIGELKGEARGLAIGEARARAKAEARDLLLAIEIALELKFGEEGLQLFPSLSQITDLDKLHAIRQAFLTANNLQDIVQISQAETVTETDSKFDLSKIRTMTKKKADLGGKRLISLAPEQWVQWVTDQTNLKVQEIISSDFQWIGRDNDVLIKVTSPSIGDLLILNELQLRYDDQVPRRMRAYAALAEERYQLPVYPVLINILPPKPPKEIPNRCESEVMGLVSRQDYRVINLSEVNVELALGPSFAPLLPFAPIMQNGNEERVVEAALQKLRLDSKLNELEPLLAFFASFVLSSEVVQRIMRWDMAVLLESPWYQEILQRGEAIGELKGEARGEARGQATGQAMGEARGIVIGEARGEAKGEAKGLLSAIEMALKLKFGEEGLQSFPSLSQITDIDKLQAILQAFLTANNLQDIVQIYQAETSAVRET